jgi:hypothetical protein
VSDTPCGTNQICCEGVCCAPGLVCIGTTCTQCATFVLSGPSGGPISVDDALFVDLLRGAEVIPVFVDQTLPGFGCPGGSPPRPPITFQACPGDQLRVRAVDNFAVAQGLGPLFLNGVQVSSGSPTVPTGPFVPCPPGRQVTFFDQVFPLFPL